MAHWRWLSGDACVFDFLHSVVDNGELGSDNDILAHGASQAGVLSLIVGGEEASFAKTISLMKTARTWSLMAGLFEKVLATHRVRRNVLFRLLEGIGG